LQAVFFNSPTSLILRDLVTSAELLHFLLPLLPSWLSPSFSSSLPALDESRAADYNNSRKLSQILISEDLNRDYKFFIFSTGLFEKCRTSGFFMTVASMCIVTLIFYCRTAEYFTGLAFTWILTLISVTFISTGWFSLIWLK